MLSSLLLKVNFALTYAVILVTILYQSTDITANNYNLIVLSLLFTHMLTKKFICVLIILCSDVTKAWMYEGGGLMVLIIISGEKELFILLY